MTSTMSTWRSNQLSYNPSRGTKMIITYMIRKCKRKFGKFLMFLRRVMQEG